MAKSYRPVNRDQPFLFPPCMRDWLPAEHPVWLMIRVVEEHLDTSAFHALRKTGGAGAAGYDPDMLLTVLIWAYAHQVTSSRRMEQLCRTDVAFMVICGLDAPDHATIARFRAAFPGVIAALFAEVLVLCARLGMGKLGVVALDGTKIAASASKSANRTEETLARLAGETVAAHGAADAEEDALFGDAAGDEVPQEAWSPRRRDGRIRAALASLRAERAEAERAEAAKAGAYLAAAAAGTPPPGPRPAGADVAAAQARLDQLTAAQQAKVEDYQRRNAEKTAATGAGLAERPPVPPGEHARVRRAAAGLGAARQRAAERDRKAAEKEKDRKGPGPVRNITDPDSRLMPVRGGGFTQGYNTQNLTSEDELIIAEELTDDTTDTGWYETMLARAEEAAALITAHQPPAQPASAPPGSGASQPAQPAGSAQPGSGASQDAQPASAQPGSGASQDAQPASAQPGSGATPGTQPASAPPGQGQDGYTGPIGLALADAGYLSEHNLTCPGPDRLIATGKHRDLEKAARDPASPGPPGTRPPGPVAAMAARLKTPDGITAYRQRGHIAETPHGHIKHNMQFRQLTMRGKPKAKAEWTFICTVHNLFKAITAGKLTRTALDALAS